MCVGKVIEGADFLGLVFHLRKMRGIKMVPANIFGHDFIFCGPSGDHVISGGPT